MGRAPQEAVSRVRARPRGAAVCARLTPPPSPAARCRASRGRAGRAIAFYSLFFVITTLVHFLVLQISPHNYTPQMGGTWAYVKFQLSGVFDVKLQGVYTYIIVLQFILEVGLFVIGALAVQWPKPALIRSESLSGCSACAHTHTHTHTHARTHLQSSSPL